MTKRTVLILAVVAMVAILAGCSNSFLGEGGNPTELTGTWTGAGTSDGAGTDTITVAGGFEGTWTKSSTILPTPIRTYNDGAATPVTTYYLPSNETTTTQTDKSRVIASDGGYVETTTETTTRVARDALTATTTKIYISVGGSTAAITAGSQVVKTVKTVTVTQNADKSYVEKAVTVETTTTVAGGTTTTVTTTDTSYATVAATSMTYDDNLITDSWTRTTSTVSSNDKVLSPTNTTYSLVIGSDGAYTLTTVAKQTLKGKAADTTTVTTVETGTTTGYQNSTKHGNDYTDSYVTFNKVKTDYTYVGTGTGVSPSFPATADTYTLSATSSTRVPYYLTKASKKTNLQVLTFIPTTLTLSTAK